MVRFLLMPNRAMNFTAILLFAFFGGAWSGLAWACGWALYAVFTAPEREMRRLRRRYDA